MAGTKQTRACNQSNLREARRMGGANGSRECAPDDKLRDTHPVLDDGDGFREGLSPFYDLLHVSGCPTGKSPD
jgi:hypothetical protein